MTVQGRDFKSLRQWDGSQYRAFEELCYQLRDPTSEGEELIKTGNPDGGLEWYVAHRNGVRWGWQAKFTFEINTLLKLMEESLKTVVNKRPKCRRLTFCIPFDLPDAPGTGKQKSARQKFEDRKASWRVRIPGAEQVRIELWSAGDILERLVGHPNQGGIERFFWDREVFSPEWCKQRLAVSVEAAGGRYSPELHIDLPVAFALEGLARSEAYWQRFRARRGAVLKAASHLGASHHTTRELQHLAKCLTTWRGVVPSCVKLPGRFEPTPLLDATRTVRDAASKAFPYTPVTVQGDLIRGDASTESRRSLLRYYLNELENALKAFESLLQIGATEAACHGALLLTGEAGQGKTHLFCDAAQRAIDAGQPAAVLFGGRMSGSSVWTEIGEQLGLGQVGSEELIGAMQASAEASNAPFLLLIDALNEAENPRAWQNELPGLLAEVAHNSWISIGVSVRSTYRKVVLPANGFPNIAEVEHQGFAGHELEATERFFSAFGLEQPGIPLLEREFTNPLFLKLYCEGLKGMGLSSPTAGEAHVSEVFERYLKSKAVRITNRLNLDPGVRLVQRAIDAFCEALADVNRDSLGRTNATEIINEFAPGRDQWPDTMLGALLSESVLTEDVARDSDSDELMDVIRFTYQQFADYRIGSALLEPLDGDPERLKDSLADGEALRNRLQEAAAGWIEALTVQMPERFGVELLDAAEWRVDSLRRRQWDEAFVWSIAARRPSAITHRSRELLKEVQQRSPELFELVLETMLSVAPSPGHPMNADFLHEWLKSLPMPRRDIVWSMPTYFAFDHGGALDRLIRWAARGPYPDCSNEVVELAAVPIVWTFTSPNRRMRDYATKALSKLLSGHLSVLPALIRRFDGVDDPYVIERLTVVSHGAVLCGGSAAPKEVITAAQELKRMALAEAQVPNIITRGAVRGVYEWCSKHNLIDCNTYREVLPPYGSSPPRKSRTEEQLEHMYGGENVDGHATRFPYFDLLNSNFFCGDFGRYVIQPKIDLFSRCPLSSPRPRNDREERYPVKEAQSWVFERVLSLGWTPEKFAEFDQCRPSHRAGSDAHKPERFGKKYQWIALRELIARVADNFYVTARNDHEPTDYAGPWEFRGRDIDPTLPPPRRLRNEGGEFELGATFSEDEAWWRPPGPRYSSADPPVGGGWAVESDDIPEFIPLLWRVDESGMRWVALCLFCNWGDKPPEDQESQSRHRRNLWCSIRSWLVQPADQDALIAFLKQRSSQRDWSLEGRKHTSAAYLGELPWAAATDVSPHTWQEVWPHDTQPTSIKIYPTWAEYCWEGSILDCSIEDSVNAWFPARVLFKAGELSWVPGSRGWCTPNGPSVARYFERGGHCALLVREDWLKRTLQKIRCPMVFVLLGEKQLKCAAGPPYVVGDWTELNGVASLADDHWKFGKRRLKSCSRGT